MRTQIKILGTIDIVLGIYLVWTLWGFIYESATDFIQREPTMTVFLIGLIIGGIGLWNRKKVGWIVNQMTGIHILISAVVGIIATNNRGTINNNGTTTLFAILLLVIVARLFWTNKQQWLAEFKLSNKVRLMTLSFGTMISLALLLKHYV